ncbi:MAG TPA: ferritin [Planctomycetota bacterium]|jgi:ferritin
MVSKKLQGAINDQIRNEYYSSYLYLAMAAWCESVNMPGFAKWLRVQQQEEWVHGTKFFEFLVDRGATVSLQTLDAPPASYKDMLDLFEHVLEHEQKVTSSINKLYEIALQEKDYPAQVLLQWFINEQVEEEKNATLIVEQIRMVSGKPGALIFIDHHVGKREK